MKEFLITFYCPSTAKSYDFWVPKAMKVEKLIHQICDAICEYENKQDIFSNREALILCSYLGEFTIHKELSLEQAGIRGGDKLALV